MKKKWRMALAAFLTGALLCQSLAGFPAAAAETVMYISDLEWTFLSVGWGDPGIDTDLDGNPISIRGSDGNKQFYEKGLTLHAPSELTYNLTDLGAKQFQAIIGISDNDAINDKNASSCAFVVEVDDQEVYRSEVIRIDSGNLEISVDIPEDAAKLTLITTDGGDGGTGDHSTWAEARLVLDADAANRLRRVEMSAPKRVLAAGETLDVQTQGYIGSGDQADLSTAEIVYASSDTDVAEVSADGRVTAKSAGPVTITADVTLDGTTRQGSLDLLVPGEAQDKQMWGLSSPDGLTTAWFGLTAQGQLVYALRQDGETVLDLSPMGFITAQGNFSSGLTMKDAGQPAEIDETYSVVSARKEAYENHAMEQVFTLERAEGTIAVQARAYDDGLAFRYTVTPAAPADGQLAVTGEATGYRLPATSTVWAMPYGSGAYNYEDIFRETTIEGLTGGQSTPLLYQTPGGTFVRLGEAMLDGSYIGTQLLPARDRLLQATFVPQQEGDVNTTAPFTSPWRTVTAGDLGAMIEGSMTENVSDDPAGEEDYSWVEAGASSWSWIIASSAWNPEPQHDPEIIKEYIDLAAEMGWKYYIMDAGWQPQSTTGDTSYEGYYDWIDEIVAYANERNVGLIAWVLADDLNTPEKRLRLDDWAAKGIKGIKVDFFDRETQDRLELQETIYEYCADLGLVVNAHGTNKPTGEVRTNPNVLTREAIRGREYGGLSVEQYTMLAYTRTAIGPADVTETVYPAGGETAGFMNALPVLVQSGIHCFAGAPEDYLNSPVYTLYKDIPVAWDDTRLVDGYPGDFVALMRRSGEKWYGAAISVEARTVEFPLDMLGEGDYYALIYKEGESRSEMALAVQKVTREDVLQVPVMENGGCAVKVVKELPSGPEAITLSEEQMTLEEKETRQLTAEITPADAEIKQVFWTSSDESVATVSADGTVTGVGEGLAVITAVSAVDPSVAATCAVRVTGPRYTLNADQWSVIRENADTRRFADENTVEITMEMGDLGEPEDSPKVIKNLFYLTPEAGDFTITAKVGGGMTMDYQTVALVAFLDDSHLVGTMRRHHSGFGGNVFDHMTYLNGYNEQTAADPNWQQDAWLKLEKRGSTFVSSYSYDGQSWTEIAQVDGGQVGTAGPDTLKVGVYASVGSGENAQMVMPISDFTYAGPDGTAQPIPFAVDNGEPSTPEEILEEAKGAAEEALAGFEASNETTADDILAAMKEAVGEDVDCAWDEPFQLTPATDEAAGSITGQISLTYDGEEALVEVDLVIAKLDGPDPVIVPGDLDKDGEVTIADVMEACKVMARESAGTDPKDDEIARGDLDGDEEITIADVMEICKILARQG